MSNLKFNSSIPVNMEGYQGATCFDAITFFDDFLGMSISATDDTNIWEFTDNDAGGTTLISNGTAGTQNTTGGMVALTTGATASDSVVLHVCGEHFQILAGYPLHFRSRFLIPDIDAQNSFIGLTTTVADPIEDENDNILGFEVLIGELNCIANNGGTQKTVDTGLTLAQDTWYNCAIDYDGVDSVRFLFSAGANPLAQVAVLTLSTAADVVPDNLTLTPTIENEAVGAAAEILYVDYVFCQQKRCLA